MPFNSSPSFLKNTLSLRRRALHFKSCILGIKQSIAYVCRLLRYRVPLAVSTLDCFMVLTLRLRQNNKAYNYSLNASITWRPWQTYSGHEQVALERTSIVYWSVLSLWEGLMGPRGSFIKLTLRMTHGAEAAALKHCDASMNTFSFSVSLS